jgi:hypothetical protein
MMLARFFSLALLGLALATSRALSQEAAAPDRLALFDAHRIIGQIVVSSDGKRFLTRGSDGAAFSWKVWDLENGKCLRTLQMPLQHGQLSLCEFGKARDTFLGVVFRGVGLVFKGQGSTYPEVMKFGLKPGDEKVLHSCVRGDGPLALWPDQGILVTQATVDGKYVADFALKFINYETKEEKWLVRETPFTLRGFTPDHKLVALEVFGKDVEVYDWAANKRISKFAVTLGRFDKGEAKGDSKKIVGSYFFRDNRTALLIVDGFTCFYEKWDIRDGKLLETHPLEGSFNETIRPPSASPDERYLGFKHGVGTTFLDLGGKLKRVGFHEAIKLKEGQTLMGTPSILRFLPDGASYLTAYDGGKVLQLKMPDFGKKAEGMK